MRRAGYLVVGLVLACSCRQGSQGWRVAVSFEEPRKGRFLGVERVVDSEECRVHVPAEASYADQRSMVLDGAAKCFEATFTNEEE